MAFLLVLTYCQAAFTPQSASAASITCRKAWLCRDSFAVLPQCQKACLQATSIPTVFLDCSFALENASLLWFTVHIQVCTGERVVDLHDFMGSSVLRCIPSPSLCERALLGCTITLQVCDYVCITSFLAWTLQHTTLLQSQAACRCSVGLVAGAARILSPHHWFLLQGLFVPYFLASTSNAGSTSSTADSAVSDHLCKSWQMALCRSSCEPRLAWCLPGCLNMPFGTQAARQHCLQCASRGQRATSTCRGCHPCTGCSAT